MGNVSDVSAMDSHLIAILYASSIIFLISISTQRPGEAEI